MRRLRKNIYVGIVSSTVLVLALVRCVNPSVVSVYTPPVQEKQIDSMIAPKMCSVDSSAFLSATEKFTRFVTDSAGRIVRNRIYSVSSYRREFPDLQDVQVASARRWGVSPVKNRAQAELRKDELVFVGSSPFFDIDPRMNRSIPYLVPRACNLLHKISRNFLDSLAVKGIPLHKIIVTSVLRTDEDVRKLRRYNTNASEESCHRFGTTFDITYNRYVTVQVPDSIERRAVRNDTLKWVLSEVLRDVRREGLCHIKYEVKQACFHITVR